MDETPEPLAAGGTNPTYRVGSRFVKKVQGVGSPHAEEWTARVFDLGGIPNLGSRAGSHLGDGHPTVVSRYLPDLVTLDRARPGHIPKLDPGRVAAQLAGEYAASVFDRHAGNYGFSPTAGFFSIDHGQAFHPLTVDPKWVATWGEDKLAREGLKGPKGVWSAGPQSALERFLLYNGYDPGEMGEFQVPPDVVRNLLTNAHNIERAAYAGTEGLPEAERVLAAKAAALRMRFLRAHATTGHPVTVDTLHEAGRQVGDYARTHLHEL